MKKEEKDRFQKIKKAMGNKMKAHAEAEASRNPIKFMTENKEPSIKGKKGIVI